MWPGEAAMREEISDESEDEQVGFYNDDSDSDLSDSLMKSQELEPGFVAASVARPPGALDDMFTIPEAGFIENPGPSATSLPPDQRNFWPHMQHSESLATFSSELFSTSVPFLSSNLKLSQPTDMLDNDVIMGRKQVSVPPGFARSSEARHVEEISQKLANFVIETDTEASITATEIGQSYTVAVPTDSS